MAPDFLPVTMNECQPSFFCFVETIAPSYFVVGTTRKGARERLPGCVLKHCIIIVL
jgi:hypothetical protein